VAQGDLRHEAEVTQELTGAIAEAFNFMLVELRGLVRRVQDSAYAVKSSATSVEGVTHQLVDGSEAQAAQIAQATSSIELMTDSIYQVTQQAANATRIAGTVFKSAQAGADSTRQTIQGMDEVRRQVDETEGTVRQLQEHSGEIGEIAKLIADVAKRTSILALNASIEAARAGAAGSGFSVVAREVENLAGRSSEAAKRVASLTKLIQNTTGSVITAMRQTTHEVKSGSERAEHAGRRLQEIQSVAGNLSQLLDSILESCRRQSDGSASISRSMLEISAVTRQATTGAQDVAGSIVDLVDLVDQLRGSVSRFRLPQAS